MSAVKLYQYFNSYVFVVTFLDISCRENVLNNLDKAVFKRPICEALLDQQYFNGMGNYLRAEALYR